MNYHQQIATEKGGPEVLSWQIFIRAAPSDGEIGVKVEAAGVLLADVLWQMGITPIGPKPPFTPGYDIVGIVDDVGSGVEGIKPGQRVAAMTQFGGYTEYAVVPAEKAVIVPDELDAVEATALTTSYLTAYMILKHEVSLKPNSAVLVHGAGGGTGAALVELASLFGHRVYGTASEGKHRLVRKKGGVPIDYHNVKFEEIINTCEAEGLDLVIDPIGGAVTTRSLQLLGTNGVLISTAMIGAMQGGGLPIPLQLLRLMFWNLVNLGKKAYFWDVVSAAEKDPDVYRKSLTEVFRLCSEGDIHPVVDQTLPMRDAAKAQDLLLNYAVKGKIVLTT